VKFKVSYSMDVLYEVDVEAESEEAAKDMVKRGLFDSDKECIVASEFLNVNDVESIDE
jgi:hypothetical protein